MEGNNDMLKNVVVEKVIEMIECVKNVGNPENFEIVIKYSNGELITQIGFLEKDSIRNARH